MQLKRAEEVQRKIQEAVIKFKTVKRRDYEQDAAEVIEEVYNKYLFRDHLVRAINCRQFLLTGLMNLAAINRSRKMWICRKIVTKIADKAFKTIQYKRENDAVYRI